MVVPHRPAILTAKMLATIDVLSKGRLIVGVGAGWMKEEFELLGAPFEERGRRPTNISRRSRSCGPRTSRRIGASTWLRRRDLLAQAGAEAASADLGRRRKPGGAAAHGQLGNAWYPGNNNQVKPLDTPARLGAAMAELRRLAEAAGRDPASIDVCLLVQNPFEWTAQKTQDGSARRLFTGTSADMAADAAALEAVGVRHVAMRLGGASLTEFARTDRPLRPRGDRP